MCNNNGNCFNFNPCSGNGGCGCNSVDCSQYRDNSRLAAEDLEFDIKTVRCGIEDLKRGICKILNGCVCDGIAALKTGACNMELGIKNLICRFENGMFDVGCKSRKLIDEAICSLKEAVCFACRAIEAAENGCIEEAADLVRKAICNAEEGLCDLIKALQRAC